MKRMSFVGFAVLAIMIPLRPAASETVTVTISDDVVDIDWQTAMIEDLPGPDGEVSFSEALIATNHTPGHDTIAFAIPTDDWVMQWLYPGRAVLRTVTGYFWRAFDTVTIDGTTQTDFTGDTNPDGWEVVANGAGIYLNADDSSLLGFDSSVIDLNGSNGLVQGNTGSMSISLYGGTGSRIARNTGGTIKIDRSSHNILVGNTVSRVRVLGWIGGGIPAVGNQVGGPNPEDRNVITGYGTYDSEGMPSGTTVQIFDSIETLIENNWIGTPDGLTQGNVASTIGIGFEGENHDAVVRGNLISGILGHGTWPHHAGEFFGWGINFQGTNSGIEIIGNVIGLDITGAPTLGSVFGIDVGSFNDLGMTNLRIGGSIPGEGNSIAGHMFNGVTVGRGVQEAWISGNAIYGNGGLGIDLVPTGYGYGVTMNDPLDTDAGGNGLQNFPVIESAVREGSMLHVTGSLSSSPNGAFTIEFFASANCNAAGYGEGQSALGATSLSTDAVGDAGFDLLLPVSVELGWVVTSTATLEANGATSEFSACVVVTEGGSASVDPDEARAGLDLAVGHPNPFREGTMIRYELPTDATVELTVYDAGGRRVRLLVAGERSAGPHSVSWNGRDDAGEPVTAGVYFYELRAGGQRLTRQAVVSR